jgi:hypothetical protein
MPCHQRLAGWRHACVLALGSFFQYEVLIIILFQRDLTDATSAVLTSDRISGEWHPVVCFLSRATDLPHRFVTRQLRRTVLGTAKRCTGAPGSDLSSSVTNCEHSTGVPRRSFVYFDFGCWILPWNIASFDASGSFAGGHTRTWMPRNESNRSVQLSRSTLPTIVIRRLNSSIYQRSHQ